MNESLSHVSGHSGTGPSHPSECEATSLAEVRTSVEARLAQLKEALSGLVPKFGKDLTKDPAAKLAHEWSERVFTTYREAFSLRLDQAEQLANTPWDVEPHLMLAPTLDLMHDKYTARAQKARNSLEDFKESLVQLWQAALAVGRPAGATSSSAEVRKMALEKATADLAPVQKIISEILPQVRACYNRREIQLVERFGLGSEREVLRYLKRHMSAEQLVFEVAKTFAQSKKFTLSSEGSTVLGAGLTRAGGSSRSDESLGDSQGFSKRELGADLVERLTAQFSEVLSKIGVGETPLSQPQRAALDRAYHRGLLGIQTFALVLEPHQELLMLWQGEFLRAVSDAFLVLDESVKKQVASVFAAQARALGAL